MGKMGNFPTQATPTLSDFIYMLSGGADVKTPMADFLALIFADALQTYSPSGYSTSGCTVASTTGFYINLGGIKLAWGQVSIAETAGVGHVQNLSLPPSFFSTVQYYSPTIGGEGGQPYQVGSGDTVGGTPPTEFSFYFSNTASGASAVVDYLMIGA